MNQSLLAAIHKLLQPLVRILLRNGIPYGTLADIVKKVYVDVAEKEFGISGRKQTVSRISTITGLSRREVTRVMDLEIVQDAEAVKRYNRAARVIGGWIRNADFLDSEGSPRVLPMEGSGATFSELVRQYSGNIPVRAILDELVRVGAVERREDNSVRLLVHAYLPKTDEGALLSILGTDVRDLVETIDHNLRASQSERVERFFQRKVSYNNLPQQIISKLRSQAQTDGQRLLEAIDRWLSKHDRDVNPKAEGTGRMRAGIGIYYFEEDLENRRNSP